MYQIIYLSWPKRALCRACHRTTVQINVLMHHVYTQCITTKLLMRMRNILPSLSKPRPGSKLIVQHSRTRPLAQPWVQHSRTRLWKRPLINTASANNAFITQFISALDVRTYQHFTVQACLRQSSCLEPQEPLDRVSLKPLWNKATRWWASSGQRSLQRRSV